MDRRAIAVRFVLGPAFIVATFFFLEKTRPFLDVWKPLLTYYAVAFPASLLIDRAKKLQHEHGSRP